MVSGTAIALALAFNPAPADTAADLCSRIKTNVQPYVVSQNFAGVAVVDRKGQAMCEIAAGKTGADSGDLVDLDTRFHIASMSMQFTAAAVLRLIEAGKLSFETTVGEILPGFPNGSAITIRQLLTQTSGIADINELPDYDQILQKHQTAATLVAKVKDLAPRQAPGGSYSHEEHSAYNLLALIIERRTGLPFSKAVDKLVFQPLGMGNSGIDDDRPISGRVAKGNRPSGATALEPAEAFFWSGKTGSGSAYSTANDERKWLRGLFHRGFLSPATRAAMFDLDSRVGYGWFKFKSKRFDTTMYSMNGRSPGFASAMAYLPDHDLSVVVLSNIYSSVTTQLGDDIAAIALGKTVDPVVLRDAPLTPAQRAEVEGTFHYGPDFYQANADVRVASQGSDLALHWPSGDVSVLLPLEGDRFMDRSYWVPVTLVRDAEGHVTQLKYDRFLGNRVSR
jgi:CubicO group peptidase (beta-lactamase class C family)